MRVCVLGMSFAGMKKWMCGKEKINMIRQDDF